LQVCVGDSVVCIKIAGRATFHVSFDFKTLVLRLRQKGYTRFILDLTDCQLMDSTFLGVMAGLGATFHAGRNGDPPATLELLNPNQRILDMLENLGIGHFFRLIDKNAPTPTTPAAETELERAPSESVAAADKRVLSRTCLEAHKFLMEINPANVPKFKDVTRFLEEDLKKLGEP